MTYSKADLLKELTRLTEEYGGYDREFEALSQDPDDRKIDERDAAEEGASHDRRD